jgi:Kelch motif/Secretion system C-terminal sorting domain
MNITMNMKAWHKMKFWIRTLVALLAFSGMLYNDAYSQDFPPPNMPHPRVGMCSARIGNKLFLIGGGTPQRQNMHGEDELESLVGTPIVDAFDFGTHTWDTTVAWLNTPRVYATAVALDDSIYVMGGVDDSGNVLKSVEVYDQTKNEWHYSSSMVYCRKGAASIAYGDSIFVFGGAGRFAGLHNTVEVYSPAIGIWNLADTLIWGRAFHNVVKIRKYIYVFGGIVSVFGPFRYIERYDPSSGSTRIGLALSSPRAFFATIDRNDSVYAISGYGSTNSTNGFYQDAALLDFRIFGRESESESSISLHLPRASFVADTGDSGKIYVFGGYSPYYKEGQLPVPSVEVVPSPATSVNVVSDAGGSPMDFSLSQNYPNPFNPTTRISYQVSAVGLITLKVYDILGREVRTLVDKIERPGKYEVQFDAGNLPSGAYIYRLESGNGISYRKMVLIK